MHFLIQPIVIYNFRFVLVCILNKTVNELSMFYMIQNYHSHLNEVSLKLSQT